MPTYDYVCRACGHRVEIHHGLYAEQPTQCPNCHSHALRKAIAAPAIVFKGTGWAKKDRSGGTTTKAAARDNAGTDAGTSAGGDDGDTAKGGTQPTGDEAAKSGRPSASGNGATAATPASGGSSPAPGVD
jgi:putative FmdB family regulatory protein